MIITAPALKFAQAIFGLAAQPHVKAVGGGILALNPTLWLRQDCGLDPLGGDGAVWSWLSEVNGHAATLASMAETNYDTNGPGAPLYMPGAYQGGVARFGLDVNGANPSPSGLYLPYSADYDLGQGVGGLTLALQLNLLPFVTPFSAATTQDIAYHGIGRLSVDNTFDWGLWATYGAGANANITCSINASQTLTISDPSLKSGTFPTIIFVINQLTSTTGTISGYLNGVLVAGPTSYTGKAATSNTYPLVIGRSQMNAGAASEYLLADVATPLIIIKSALNAAQVLAMHNAMTGQMTPNNLGVPGQNAYGALTLNAVTKSAPYTITLADFLVRVSGNTTISLPDATTCPGQAFGVLKTDTSATTATVAAGLQTFTMSGAPTSMTITSQGACLIVMSNGTGWDILKM